MESPLLLVGAVLLVGLLVGMGVVGGVLVARRGGGTSDASAGEVQQQVVAATQAALGQQLSEATRQLAELNEQRLRAQNEQSRDQADAARERIEALVGPLQAKLTDLDRHVRELESQRTGAYAKLDQQVVDTRTLLESLRTETNHLNTALRRSDTRGRWGELQLERVIELAGMTEHVAYDRQVQQTGDGTGRPDVTVHLTDQRVLYIDAKAPMTAFQDAVAEADPDRRTDLLARHAKALAGHVAELQRRRYTDDTRSLPFMVLFVPTEASLAAACDADPRLIEDALGKGVAIASPTSLAMMLTTVSLSWRQQRFTENAREILEDVGELHKRIGVFSEHLAKVGGSLETTIKHYNAAIGSLERRLLPAARAIEAHGGATDRLPAPSPVVELPRPVPAVATAAMEAEGDD
jgi:DNA recombination protein RmuC